MCARWTRDMVGVLRPVASDVGVTDDISGYKFGSRAVRASVSIVES